MRTPATSHNLLSSVVPQQFIPELSHKISTSFIYLDTILQDSNMLPAQNKLDNLVNRFSVNPHERCLMNKLEDDIEELKSIKDAKKELLSFLKEQEEISRAEYEAQKELSLEVGQSLSTEVEGMKQTSRALQGYLKIMNTDEFALNKLKRENDSYIRDTHARLSSLVKRARDLRSRLDTLKGTNEKCLELEKKAQLYMRKNN